MSTNVAPEIDAAWESLKTESIKWFTFVPEKTGLIMDATGTGDWDEFLGSFGPSDVKFGIYRAVAVDDDSRRTKFVLDINQKAEAWPTYTSEELLQHLKEMRNRVINQASYRKEPCKTLVQNLIEMYKTVSNGKEWSFGCTEDDTFKIESSDDEMIVNYKICMMAAEALPNAFLFEENNQNTARGFLKHIYCLDSTFGTNMLNFLNVAIGQTEQPITLYTTQSMKIPDWKISLFVATIKIAEAGVPSLQVKYFLKHFKSLIVTYYNASNWEGSYIDMNDMDCILLDLIYKSKDEDQRSMCITRLGKTAYQHIDNPKIPSIREAYKSAKDLHPFFTLYQEVSYDINVIEKESIKIFPKEEKYKRVRKIISIMEIIDQRGDNNIVESISSFLTRLLKYSDEELVIDCLRALSSPSNNQRNFSRCKNVVQAILPLLERESLIVREEAYNCGAKHLTFDYAYDSQIMHKILKAFSLNPIPKVNYLKIFTAAFKYCCTESIFSEKALEVIQKVAECMKEQDYFLQVADSIQALLNIPALPSVFSETLVRPLDEIVRGAIDSKSLEVVDIVQKLVESLLNTELTKLVFKNLGNIVHRNNLPETKECEDRLNEISKHFQIPEMLGFLVENDRELSPIVVSFFFDVKFFKGVRIHPEIGNEEVIVKSLAKSKSKDAHITLGQHNLDVRPKHLNVDDIFDAITDCISFNESRSLYVTSLLKRITQQLEVQVNTDSMEEDTSDEDDDYNSDDSDDLDMGYIYGNYYDEDDDDDDDSDDHIF
ncbi:predicted protein [Naegleria gruberi]|uniref:Predicted protein n=1 Tax=Naegleria gruberi TaxID=5762 RepID=D2W4T4_NAEGR|nr:uncharacterized protein NAEGRDRAFT_76421 [Naegleria gruberi]EFC35919.1 predicted protein [Naegleria gruberi]|eukprot:XP_002668663.1 predicted protein [Naegleria gruberi strain NEG-M]